MTFTPVTATYTDENMSATMSSTFASRKRKRLSAEQNVNGTKRSSLTATNGNSNSLNGGPESFSDSSVEYANLQNDAVDDISNTAAAALTAHLNGDDQDSFNMDSSMQSNNHDSPYGISTYQSGGLHDSATTPTKPAVGTDEWHKVRRDNHKEVERRRRETINEGINELAKIVPGSEKNKGSILQRAVTYINDLKAKEAFSEEKKAMEKNVMEQAVQELMVQNQTLKDRNEELEAQAAAKDDSIDELRGRLAAAEDEDGD